MLKDTRIGCIK